MRWTLAPVGAEFFDTAPHRFHAEAVVRRPPEELFDLIATEPSRWGDWFPGFDHSGRWVPDREGTKMAAPGPGSRRTVRMAGVAYEETILAFDPGRRFAFRLDRAGAPFARALAEDYRVDPHPSGAVLRWTFAIAPGRVLRALGPLLDPALGRLFRRVAANLERVAAANPPR